MPIDSVVRARIDAAIKDEAMEALAAMGLSVSDAIRLLLTRVAADKALPFSVKVPNARTRKAILELEQGKGKRSRFAAALLKDLDL
ncbi:MAG: type II toxin-antitoxin system RelB/DinJ family antitoxin [Acidiferrobacter sp.]